MAGGLFRRTATNQLSWYDGRRSQAISEAVFELLADSDAITDASSIEQIFESSPGNDIEVLVRMGATQDIVWLQRFQDLSAYEKSLEAVQSDPDYQARVKNAQSKEFFDSPNVEAGIWRQL